MQSQSIEGCILVLPHNLGEEHPLQLRCSSPRHAPRCCDYRPYLKDSTCKNALHFINTIRKEALVGHDNKEMGKPNLFMFNIEEK